MSTESRTHKPDDAAEPEPDLRPDPRIDETLDACPVCGASRFEFYLKGKSLYTPYWFDLCRCRDCSLVFVNPRVSAERIHAEVSKTYSAFDFFASKWIFDRAEFRQNIVGPARRLHPPLAPGDDPRGRRRTWLDVGCAVGNLLEVAREAGYEPHGLELNKKMVEWVRANRPEIDVTCGLWGDLPAGRVYDVISYDNVLEHIHRPGEFIRESLARLASGGLLVIRVPNFNNFARRPMEWTGRLATSYLIDPDAHPCYHGRKSLLRLLELEGLKPVRVMEQVMISYPLKHILARRLRRAPEPVRRLAAAALPITILTDRLIPRGGIDITVFARRK